MKVTIAVFGMGLLWAGPATAQVLITEVQPNPTGVEDAEWVEIHNTGTSQVDISGWLFNDFGPAVPREYGFPAGTSLAAGQVIIVARSALDYTAMALGDFLPVVTPDFELAVGADDPNVPNLDIVNAGSGTFGLTNTGDGVQLRDASGAVLSTAEWGNGRPEIPGNPVDPSSGSGESLIRVDNTGSSQTDFQVTFSPNPGTGYSGPIAGPPAIFNESRATVAAVWGVPLTISADVVDSSGLPTVQAYMTFASAPFGTADRFYLPVGPSVSGTNYQITHTVGTGGALTFGPPQTFDERYVRYFFYAADTGGADATSPPGPAPRPNISTGNLDYYWENVLPAAATTPISQARTQNASELPIYDGHSVRIQGIALTSHVAFQTNNTNLFVTDVNPNEIHAIRIFDFGLSGPIVQPGDEVIVVGKVGTFRGVRQVGLDNRSGQTAVLGAEAEVQVISALPRSLTPYIRQATIGQLLASAEQYESQLVELSLVTAVDQSLVSWPSDANVEITDGVDTLSVRIFGNTDLPGLGVPTAPFNLRGLFSQFAPSGTGGYQLQPRGSIDLLMGAAPIDAGVLDSGLPFDGGVGIVDSGVIVPDTGVAVPDTGVAIPDTGVAVPDSGVVVPDTGVAAPDASGDMDGAVPPADTGLSGDGGVGPRPDAGGFLDATVTPGADGGPSATDGGPVDAGPVVDSGRTSPIRNPNIRNRGDGCGCSSAETNTPPRWWGYSGLFALGWMMRRRRRASR